jgi:molybdopterin-binding protein
MKLSTRNTFVGTITNLVRGPVSTEVTIRVAQGVEIVSVITTHSAKRLKLKKGQRANALIKADHVIVGVDERQARPRAGAVRASARDCRRY